MMSGEGEEEGELLGHVDETASLREGDFALRTSATLRYSELNQHEGDLTICLTPRCMLPTQQWRFYRGAMAPRNFLGPLNCSSHF